MFSYSMCEKQQHPPTKNCLLQHYSNDLIVWILWISIKEGLFWCLCKLYQNWQLITTVTIKQMGLYCNCNSCRRCNGGKTNNKLQHVESQETSLLWPMEIVRFSSARDSRAIDSFTILGSRLTQINIRDRAWGRAFRGNTRANDATATLNTNDPFQVWGALLTHTHVLTDCLPLLRIDLMTMLEKVTFCPKSSVKVTNKPQPSILNLTSLAVVGGYWLLFAQQTDRPSVYVVCDTLFVNVTQVTTETASSRVHVFSTFLPGGRHHGGLVGSATHTLHQMAFVWQIKFQLQCTVKPR